MRSADDGAGEEPAASDFPVHRRFSTRWADNDVYGHLNNVVYYEFFDSAVNGWLIEATGLDIRGLPAIGVFAYEDGELHPRPRALGRFVHVCVDAQTRRPVPVPGPVRSALTALHR